MFLWRISLYADLSGAGAERSDGRWHTASHGKRIVYLAEHPAVALLENIANLSGDPSFFPDHFQLLKIDPQATKVLDPARTPDPQRVNLAATREFGDHWLAAKSSVLLRVPSVPSPESWNYLFNPLHPEASEVKMIWAKQIVYDTRLFHLKEK